MESRDCLNLLRKAFNKLKIDMTVDTYRPKRFQNSIKKLLMIFQQRILFNNDKKAPFASCDFVIFKSKRFNHIMYFQHSEHTMINIQ